MFFIMFIAVSLQAGMNIVDSGTAAISLLESLLIVETLEW